MVVVSGLFLFSNSSLSNSLILNSDFNLKTLFPESVLAGRAAEVVVQRPAVQVKSCSRATHQMRCSQFFLLFRTALGSSGVPGTSHSPAFKNGCADNSAVIQTILGKGPNVRLLLLLGQAVKHPNIPSEGGI